MALKLLIYTYILYTIPLAQLNSRRVDQLNKEIFSGQRHF